MRAVIILFILLTVLEWVFWLSPVRTWFNRVMQRLGDWYMLFPYHYLVRLALLGGVLLWAEPDLGPLFAGGWNWVWSLGLGLLLAGLSYRRLVLMSGVRVSEFTERAASYHRSYGGWAHGTTGEGRTTLIIVCSSATLFAVLLTLVTILTQNLAGAILAHAFGDWAGTVVRHRVKERPAA